MKQVKVNDSYEIYQIITDFADPLEIFREAFQNAFDEDATEVYCRIHNDKKMSSSDLIIDIWNNGTGLPSSKSSCFFDLANSSKVTSKLVSNPSKIGYKGHGSKIFFNAEEIIICSKTKNETWAAKMDDPLKQIENKKIIEYIDGLKPAAVGIDLPPNWEEGFFVRIIKHKHFIPKFTHFKLNHAVVRDYSKWFTVFGTINTLFDDILLTKNIKLFLHGLGIDDFKKEFSNRRLTDPLPVFDNIGGIDYEVIELGHYFPDKRSKDTEMIKYANSVNSNKPYYHFYSNLIKKDTYRCRNDVKFKFVVSVEGYETKRMYDKLLTRRGIPRKLGDHTDSERYGFWACKNGIPVQKVDEWIETGKGTYSFIKAFIDCDDFRLTANRGSINNTDIEKLDSLKSKVNEIFKGIQNSADYKERTEIEIIESQRASVADDGVNLKKRFTKASKRQALQLPYNKGFLVEPTKLNKRDYSESETMVLLIQLLSYYPDLFDFKMLDYNTTNGIDFVVEHKGSPKYIELKGTMHKSINHPFQHIYKFICYDLAISESEIVTDIENFEAELKVNKFDAFKSKNSRYNSKVYTSYVLQPANASITSMEIICLKSILKEVLRVK